MFDKIFPLKLISLVSVYEKQLRRDTVYSCESKIRSNGSPKNNWL